MHKDGLKIKLKIKSIKFVEQIKESVLQDIVKMIKDDWSSSLKIPWEHEIMVKHSQRGRAITKVGYLILFGNTVNLSLELLFEDINFYRTVNNITDPYADYILPIQSYYPFDYGWSPMYEILFLIHVILGTFIAIFLCIPDFFFGILVFHACAVCEIVEGHTRALLSDENIDKLDYSLFRNELRKIVKKHLQLIR